MVLNLAVLNQYLGAKKDFLACEQASLPVWRSHFLCLNQVVQLVLSNHNTYTQANCNKHIIFHPADSQRVYGRPAWIFNPALHRPQAWVV